MKVGLDLNKAMNVLGYIPVIGTVTASARMIAGQAEMIYGIAMTVFSGMETLHSGIGAARGTFPIFTEVKEEERQEFIKETAKQYVQLQNSLDHVKNGFLNVVRATIEAIPVVSYMVLYPFDQVKAEVVRLNENQKRENTGNSCPSEKTSKPQKFWGNEIGVVYA